MDWCWMAYLSRSAGYTGNSALAGLDRFTGARTARAESNGKWLVSF